MKVVLFFDPIEAATTFVVMFMTALIPGVVIGSTLADYYGGYKGRGMRHALTLCCFFAFMATVFSIWLSFTFEPTQFIILLWAFFFWGAGMMPIAGGIIVGCVPKFARNSASAFYCICMNVIGLAGAPIITG